MLGCNCFPAVEDRATLRSDPSAAAGEAHQTDKVSGVDLQIDVLQRMEQA